MYNHLFRFLPALLLLILLCGTVQATNLQITVQDGLDNTLISQATVYQDGINAGRTATDGTFLIVHAGLSDQNIRIAKAGYEDWEQTVGMNVTDLLVNMTRKTLVLTVQLYDSDSLEKIPNADVELTYNTTADTKKSDSNGLVTFPVTANSVYDIAISAPLYQSQVPRAIEIGIENKEVQYWLMRNDRFSVIVSDPDGNPIEGAEVYLDSELKGKTDTRGFSTLRVERGRTYLIEVKKEGFQSFVERKSIGEEEALITVRIAKVPIGAFISVYDENRDPVEGASVFIDKTRAGSTDRYGKYIMGSITAGTYQLEIRMDGYLPLNKTITIARQGDEFTVELPYDETDLTVFVQDRDQKVIPGARVLVNGNDAGLTGENGQLATQVKFNSANNITVSKEGYLPASVQKQVMIGNASASVTITLERNLDWGFIGLIVLGAIGVILVFAVVRHMNKRRGRHIVRRNEI